ncbi:hypothetical protein FLL78_16440 [Vibrio cholerae]|uniref:HNH endonuclease n=1 Tax=Vibrio cholerae TaxID=666 RepID=UPI001157FD1A|nr:HNH endonuclease [Vibrio cholerae]TQQ00622.1 hypothetical protein FLL78_16440 [Vibrio cholerae]
MRPISRPEYTETHSNYKKFLEPLIESFGSYCSYCERVDKLDVEHVAPKSKNQDLEVNWTNLLLGCPRCNRDFKKSKNDNRVGYVWPDTHDTFRLLQYFDDGRVKPNEGLQQPLKDEVKNTINLVCLDDSKQPQKTLNLARRRKFKIANIAKTKYQAGNHTVDEILLFAEEGFWSVWFTVFQDVIEVRDALLDYDSYPNTFQAPNQ